MIIWKIRNDQLLGDYTVHPDPYQPHETRKRCNFFFSPW